MKKAVQYLQQPLDTLSLQGLHLIEASAGTGKTWTLSGLMVRILTEKYMPRQVIATTFTRAAAAELKSRIRKRLSEIYDLAQYWQAHQPQGLAIPEEPLENIVFEHFHSDFTFLVNRLALVLNSLDELFVGTIDSFTQKLLREFAFESGEIRPRQVSDDEQQYIYQIAHDALRAWLQSQSQETINLLLAFKQLKSTESYIKKIASTLNFRQAKLQPVSPPILNRGYLNPALEQLGKTSSDELEQLKDFFFDEGQYYKVVSKHAFKAERWQALADLIAQLQQSGVESVITLPQAILAIFLDSKGVQRKKLFNKCDPSIPAIFKQNPIIIALQQVVTEYIKLEHQLHNFDAYIHYYLSIELKRRLPQALLAASETTFGQQTQSLSDALNGEKGQQLAQAILQRYPMILVDEFQDTSQEQDHILQTIWRDKVRHQYGCFIAVGDPKQAIYGFRGGDILTYINAFNDIAQKQGHFYRLSHNYRSIPALVTAVDALFLRHCQFGEGIDYYAAQSGKSDDVPLFENGCPDRHPLRWLNFNELQTGNEALLIAQKIRHLLVQAQQGQLYIEQQGQKQTIIADDIAVLAASHRELERVQHYLIQFGIPVNRSTQNSVFSSQSAQDVGAILQAIQQPEQERILKRALLTAHIGFTLADFCRFEQDAEGLSQQMQCFREARQLWLQKGFLIAWQWLAEKYQIWQTLTQNMAMFAERAIVNTRHVIELLAQQSRHYSSVQHLLKWYQTQLGSPALREWELERKLSNEAGVQLMTIHKSKGLEFKIVFLLHANQEISDIKKKAGLGFYQEQSNQDALPTRVIAISPTLLEDNDAAKQANLEKLYAENHRLWYVALTRASYRLYVSLYEKKNPSHDGVAFWLNANEHVFEHPFASHEEVVSPEVTYQDKSLQQVTLRAMPYPSRKFYPQTRTSFTQLAAHVNYKAASDSLAEVMIESDAAEDEQEQSVLAQRNVVDNISTTSVQPLTWIRRYFPKGAKGGNCLHEILENIEFASPVYWEDEIRQQLYQHSLWTPLLEQYALDFPQQTQAEMEKEIIRLIKAWIKDITETPFIAQNEQQLSLKHIKHYFSELKFYLSLAEQRHQTQSLQALFIAQGIDTMPDFELQKNAHFLNGAIDLVFFDGQRYHVADYKSNTLGEFVSDYQQPHIEHSMSKASYWLQAALYLVALHRYLKNNLENYAIAQHLGAAHYLYLRGMTGQVNQGLKSWQPDYHFILTLDKYLGTAFVDNSV